MRVTVIGAGAIGLSCARSLAAAGADVVVLERGRVGEGCSFGNTGWICPVLSAPLPGPKVMGRALLGMGRRDSPLLVQPRLDAAFLRWSWRFWRASTPGLHEAGLRATLALARDAFELYDRLAEETGLKIHRSGMVIAARTEAGLAEYVAMIEGAQRAGYDGPVEILDGDGLRRREPALAGDVVGGIFVGAERYVRPEELTAVLAETLRAGGGEIVEGAAVTGLTPRGGRWRLEAGDHSLECDQVVLAAGAWSARLLATLGVRAPFEAAKGYSVRASGEGTPPSHALYLAEAKVGASPFSDGVRLAGIFDLTGIDSTLRRKRIDAIIRTSKPYFGEWRPEPVLEQWAGLRPYPADGLPIIGGVPGHQGLVAATGHGRMGITLAPGTGEAVRSIVLDGRTPAGARPFALERLLG